MNLINNLIYHAQNPFTHLDDKREQIPLDVKVVTIAVSVIFAVKAPLLVSVAVPHFAPAIFIAQAIAPAIFAAVLYGVAAAVKMSYDEPQKKVV